MKLAKLKLNINYKIQVKNMCPVAYRPSILDAIRPTYWVRLSYKACGPIPCISYMCYSI